VHFGALQKFMGLRARWERGSGKQYNGAEKCTCRDNHAFHLGSSILPGRPIIRPCTVFASCREALRWRCTPGEALRERAGPDAEVTFVDIIRWG
jgi:hypothetical protein